MALHLQAQVAAGIGQGQGGREAGAALGCQAGRGALPVSGPQCGQQPGDAFGVAGGVAGGMHPRRPSQGIDRQARIIGQGPAAGCLGHRDRFEAGIFHKGEARFLHLQALGLGPDLQAQTSQQGGEFAHLAGVAAGDHQGGGGRAVVAQIDSASCLAQSSTSATRSAVGDSQ